MRRPDRSPLPPARPRGRRTRRAAGSVEKQSSFFFRKRPEFTCYRVPLLSSAAGVVVGCVFFIFAKIGRNFSEPQKKNTHTPPKRKKNGRVRRGE